ncbi:hypothetical protein DI09_38p270 [Mitosporidium daphniae]|uniref:Brl1/Brr6 domain-containing protein n=1 Tax=Mitosporidium daphniae TaxID=1485682 RepID=A0A098VQS7_9MICR|nr:uncharacterized protein DI09_38p270 [Mitosporidium daphniae]KGG51357.1 hypothetical protein DI09_38p270 [Mitosporidium daphniae]|eukprot:XP_013237784.1 uncharacterized protein DI09_38p270 [Mitosporidium daphniae]
MYSSGRSKASPMDWNRNVETPSFPFPVKRKDASKLCQETPLSNTTAGMQLSNKTPTVPLSQQSSGLASMPSANLEDSTTSIEEAEKNSSSLKKSEQCTAQLKNKGPASFPAKFFASFTDLLNARNISILPYILIGYLRLVFHLTWLLTFIWGIWALYAILMNDVSIKINAETNLIIQEIEQAKMLFSQNKCFNEDVIRNSPALDSLCAGWKTKAEQSDPRSKISHGKLMAETIAEIINSFVERITLRSLMRAWRLQINKTPSPPNGPACERSAKNKT